MSTQTYLIPVFVCDGGLIPDKNCEKDYVRYVLAFSITGVCYSCAIAYIGYNILGWVIGRIVARIVYWIW